MGVGFVGGQLHLCPFRGLVRVRVGGSLCASSSIRGDEPFRVGVGAFHVDDPFAAPSGVFVAQAAVGVELAFEVGIDAAFEPVGVVGRAVLLEVGEERACVRASCVPHCGH